MVAIVDHGYYDHQTSKGATNNVSLCATIIPMFQLPIQWCMHFSQLHTITQLTGVFTQVAVGLNFTNS